MHQLSRDLLEEINHERNANPFIMDFTLNSLFNQIYTYNETLDQPYVAKDDIIKQVFNTGSEPIILCDYNSKLKASSFSRFIGRNKQKYFYWKFRLSDTAILRIRQIFAPLKQQVLQLDQQHKFTHCSIYIQDTAAFYFILIILQQKYVIVNLVNQTSQYLLIEGHSSIQLQGIQLLDGEMYYEIQDEEIQQRKLLNNSFQFEIKIPNKQSMILPIVQVQSIDPPQIQFFTTEQMIGSHLLRETEIINKKLLEQRKENMIVNPTKIALNEQLEKIKYQKQHGIFEDVRPKILFKNNFQPDLFQIEESLMENMMSSAKTNRKQGNDIDSYTANVEQRFLQGVSRVQPQIIDGLISGDSIISNSNSYLPLTHKDQSSLSSIQFNQRLNTQDSQINEEKLHLQQIYNELSADSHIDHRGQQQPQYLNQQSIQSEYFDNPNHNSLQYTHSHQTINSLPISVQQVADQSSFIAQQPVANQYQYPYDYQQQQQQAQQQQQYVNSQSIKSEYFNNSAYLQSQQGTPCFQQIAIPQQQQQYFQNYQGQIAIAPQQLQWQQEYYNQQLYQQQQQQLLYQEIMRQQVVNQYSVQKNKYEKCDEQPDIKDRSEDSDILNPHPSSPKLHWSDSPKHEKKNEIVPKLKRRSSNPELRNKSLIRFSLRQSVISSKNVRKPDLMKQLKQQGGKIVYNEVQFAVKLKQIGLQPIDMQNQNSQRAKRIISELEIQMRKQSVIYVKDHNFQQLYKNDKLSDLTIKIRNCEYRSHKTVLAQVSPYFNEILSKQNSFEFDCDPKAFDFIYKFIYLGRLHDSDWDRITIDQSPELYLIVKNLKIITFFEQLCTRVIIPKLNHRYILDWYIASCRNSEVKFNHIFTLLNNYTINYFQANSLQIIEIMRNRSLTIENPDYHLSQALQQQFETLSSEEIQKLIQAPLIHCEIIYLDHLLWLITSKHQCTLNELITKLSMDHYDQQGFIYKNFKDYDFENYLPIINSSVLIQKIKQQQQKEVKKKSIVHGTNQFEYTEQQLQEHEFYHNNIITSRTNSKPTYELKLSSLEPNQIIVSDCFASASSSWRLIMETQEDQGIKVYLQERGQIKSNIQFMNLDESQSNESPQLVKLTFLSVECRIELHDREKIYQERSMFHSYPLHQFHNAGFTDLKMIFDSVHIKVFIQEHAVHSAIMTQLANNPQLINLNMPYFILYSLLKSDMLNIQQEDHLFPLLSQIQQSQQNLDLIVYPIRFSYFALDKLFQLAKYNPELKNNLLFLQMLNYTITQWLQSEQFHTKPRKFYGQNHIMLNKEAFKVEWLKWLIFTDERCPLQIDTNQAMKNIQKNHVDAQTQVQQIIVQKRASLLDTDLHLKLNNKFKKQNETPKVKQAQEYDQKFIWNQTPTKCVIF